MLIILIVFLDISQNHERYATLLHCLLSL
jgi:hypothetical protein